MTTTLNRIGAHVAWLPGDHSTDRPVLGVVTGTQHTLLVDAGNSPDHVRLLRNALAAAVIAPPTLLVLTHWHWDHVFGTGALDLLAFASRETRAVVAHMAQQDWSDAALDERVANGSEIAFCRDMIKAELPDRSGLMIQPPAVAFSDTLELDLGGVVAQIAHVGGDHASDSSVVYVPEAKVVFLSDCLYPAIYAPERYYTPTRLFPLVDRLLAYDADTYITGHDDAPMSRAELIAWTSLLKAASASVERHGDNRDAIIAELIHSPYLLPDDDPGEFADYFLVGRQYDAN